MCFKGYGAAQAGVNSGQPNGNFFFFIVFFLMNSIIFQLTFICLAISTIKKNWIEDSSTLLTLCYKGFK